MRRRIVVKDEVLVYQGERLLFKSKGHFVGQGFVGMVDLLGLGRHPNVSGFYEHLPSNNWGSRGTIKLGTGQGETHPSMTTLVKEYATNPNSHSGQTTNPSVGVYAIAWIATWNAGALPAITVYEMCLKLYLYRTLYSFGELPTSGAPDANTMCSRLSAADGDFSPFTVNVAVPLTVEWRMTFSFQ